jgi:hypothetical protein
MNPAGRADELGYQLALAALELRRKPAVNDSYCALAA